MQATALGRYLFYGAQAATSWRVGKPVRCPFRPRRRARRCPCPAFRSPRPPPTATACRARPAPSEAADWRVDAAGDAFTSRCPGRRAGARGRRRRHARHARPRRRGRPRALRVREPRRLPGVPGGRARRERRPVARQLAVGRGARPGRRPHAHDGLRVPRRPHPLRPPVAPLRRGRRDGRLPRPRARRDRAAAENVLSHGDPTHRHDTVGWPTFKDWPSHASLTHEQSYYRWLERSWRAGQRIFVNLLVDNAVLCTVYPLKKNSCNEMDGVRLQARRIHELEDYIDAQNGGPGKGWFRIVDSPVRGAARDQRRQARGGPRHRGLQALRLRPRLRARRVHGGADRPPPRRGPRDGRARHGARQQVRQRARGRRGRLRRDRARGQQRQRDRDRQVLADGQLRRPQPRPRPLPVHGAGDRARLAGRQRPARLRPDRRRPDLPARAALQRARAVRARRPPRAADDRQEDDHRPRPPERARAPAAARASSRRRATRGSSRATPGAPRTRSRASTGSEASSRPTPERPRTS